MALYNFAAVKVAVEICNNHQLKKEIFCVFNSEYGEHRSVCRRKREIQWAEIVEKNARIILDDMCLTKQLQEKVIGALLLIGMRILSWATYHEVTLGFSRNYSFNFFNSITFITSHGIVDCKKAAEAMLMDTHLTIKQKYKLALLYCMNQHIPALDKQMTMKEKEEFYNSENPSMIQQPHFVKFWSYYLKDEVDKLSGDTDPNTFWLQMAVRSGNKDVVEYFLEQTNWITVEDALIYAAKEAVNNSMDGVEDSIIFNDFEDGIGTASYGGNGLIEQWVPHHYYTGVLCFLFSKMRRDTQIAFLKEDLVESDDDPDSVYSRVLELFLDFPYHDYFLKSARLMWDFLPHSSYIELTINFIQKIGNCEGCQEYGEGLFYDYKELLRKFLEEIPEPYKRFVFTNYNFDNGTSYEMLTASIIVISHLFTQENYTYQDKIIIEWLLDNATNEEKENIISSWKGEEMCVKLIQLKRWRLLEEFVSNCYISKEKEQKFKRELSITEEAYNACINFISNEEWHEVESFMRWSTLTDVDINKLKEKMIYSEYGKIACLKTISQVKKLTGIDKVIKWCFLSEEKATEFKEMLIFHSQGMAKCKELVIADQVDLANEFTKWCLSSEEEIKQYKKYVGNKIGRDVCETLIYCDKKKHYSRGSDKRKRLFPGGNWIKVELFLTWCFTSEDEINNFKKSFTVRDADLIQNRLIDLHFDLINNGQWEDADILYNWLCLSINEIRELKKETILSIKCMHEIYTSLEDTDHRNFLNYAGGKWEKVELLLRWCLEEVCDVLEFKNMYDALYGFKSYKRGGIDIPEKERNNLNQFYFFIKEFLNDLRQQ